MGEFCTIDPVDIQYLIHSPRLEAVILAKAEIHAELSKKQSLQKVGFNVF
jgi:hypothetical protein